MNTSTLIAIAILLFIFLVVGFVCLIVWIQRNQVEHFEWDESCQAWRKITKIDSTNSYDNLDWVDIKQTFINRK